VSVLRPIASIGDHRKSRAGGYLLVLLFGLGAGGAGGYWLGTSAHEAAEPAGGDTARTESAPAPATAVATAPAEDAKPAADAPTGEAPAAPVAQPTDDIQSLDVSISGSLYATLAKHIDGRHADILNAQVGRILVWWFDLRRDVLKGDRVQILFRPIDDPNELELLAVRYTSRKMNKTYAAYRFRAGKARYPRYYDDTGQEIELRLANPPLSQYEQVTELMNMAGRRHRGIDFKADVGTEIRAPFRSKVMRRNWSTRRNGNCLHLLYLDSGVTALFLHLEEILPETKVGQIVEAGTVVAKTGNTGHSTAPHLHYELHNRAGKPVNPLKVHSTLRVKLEKEDLEKFTSRREWLDARLNRGAAGTESAPGPSATRSARATPGKIARKRGWPRSSFPGVRESWPAAGVAPEAMPATRTVPTAASTCSEPHCLPRHGPVRPPCSPGPDRISRPGPDRTRFRTWG
jgi:murein DD-endopeptidase MepM/ murein hydrolase activator NlpD